MATTADYFKLHFIVFLWGFTAILGKLISLPSVEMVFYRTLMAMAGMFIFIRYSKINLDIPSRDIVKLLLTGFIVAAHWISFFGSAKIANVSVSLVGFATASLWTAIIHPLSNRKRIKPMEVLLGSFALIGIVVIFSFDFRYKAGFLLAIFSGFTAALFAVINSHIIHRVKAPVITFYEMAGAFISIVVFLPLYKKLWAADGALHLAPTLADWLFITILALVCTVYAYAAMINLMKKISVFFIQLTLNLEPLYGIIMAVILFGDAEKMSGKFYVGGCIILSSVIAYPLLKRKMARHF